MAISKTVAASLSDLYEVTANAAKRRQWFPRGELEPSSRTRNKYFRGAWNKTARIEIGFYAKGAGKSQIAVGVSKLAKRADVELQRSAWKRALEKLASMGTRTPPRRRTSPR